MIDMCYNLFTSQTLGVSNMGKHFLIAAVITSSVILAGCSSPTTDLTEPTDTPTSQSPSIEPAAPAEPSSPDEPSAPETGEELTPKVDNGIVDVTQRSLKDLSSLDASIKNTMIKINQTGLVQFEESASGQNVYVYDSARAAGEKGILWFDLGNGESGAAPMPAAMIASFSGNGGLFRIDSLLLDAITIRDMLTSNTKANGSIPAASAYESIATQSGYELVSPILRSPIKITLTDGLITKIEETQDNGDIITYTFKFNVSDYKKSFDEAYPKK